MGRAPAVYKAPRRDLCSARVSVGDQLAGFRYFSCPIFFFLCVKKKDKRE